MVQCEQSGITRTDDSDLLTDNELALRNSMFSCPGEPSYPAAELALFADYHLPLKVPLRPGASRLF